MNNKNKVTITRGRRTPKTLDEISLLVGVNKEILIDVLQVMFKYKLLTDKSISKDGRYIFNMDDCDIAKNYYEKRAMMVDLLKAMNDEYY